MYSYNNETGDFEWTTDKEQATRRHIALMVGASSYPLNPEAVGQLQNLLGPVPVDATTDQAERQVQRALAELGLGSISVEAAAETLSDEWQMLLKIGGS